MSLERLGVGTYKTTCAADTEYFGELIAPCLELSLIHISEPTRPY